MRRILATVCVCALLLLAGCSGTPDTAGNGTEATATNGTTMEEATTAESTTAGGSNATTGTDGSDAAPTDANFTFRSTGSGQVQVVHMGGSEITNESTDSVVVSVGDTNTTWVSDDANESAQSYPISVGNLLTVNATAGDTVEVIWIGEEGSSETLGSYEVEASSTTTATTTAAGNETTAGNATTTNGTTTATTTAEG